MNNTVFYVATFLQSTIAFQILATVIKAGNEENPIKQRRLNMEVIKVGTILLFSVGMDWLLAHDNNPALPSDEKLKLFVNAICYLATIWVAYREALYQRWLSITSFRLNSLGDKTSVEITVSNDTPVTEMLQMAERQHALGVQDVLIRQEEGGKNFVRQVDEVTTIRF